MRLSMSLSGLVELYTSGFFTASHRIVVEDFNRISIITTNMVVNAVITPPILREVNSVGFFRTRSRDELLSQIAALFEIPTLDIHLEHLHLKTLLNRDIVFEGFVPFVSVNIELNHYTHEECPYQLIYYIEDWKNIKRKTIAGIAEWLGEKLDKLHHPITIVS